MTETTATPEKKAVKSKKAATAKTAAKPKASPAKTATAAKKTTVAKTKAKPAAKKTKATPADLQQHYKMVEVAAYYIAERNGFAGNPVDYWIAAELQINKTS
jgi:hypothetical protein